MSTSTAPRTASRTATGIAGASSHGGNLRYALMVGALLALTIPIFWYFGQVKEGIIDPGTWTLVIISAFANVVVIIYHYAVPPHPKFLMIPWRKWVLRVHITSGTVELFAGLVAIAFDQPAAAVVMACAALFFHVPSAFFQTSIVFGSKAVMVPAYLLCIATHAFCAGMLLSDPTSQLWAVNTFLVFNVYVWCRVYFYLFDWLKLFSSMKYSISILAAGATMIPALFGPMGFMLLVSFVGAYILAYRFLIVGRGAAGATAYLDFVREKARDATIDRDLAALWGSSDPDGKESQRVAKQFFDTLDADRDGFVTGVELQTALSTWGLPQSALDNFAAATPADDKIDFKLFNQSVWMVSSTVRQRASRFVGVRNVSSERDKAELVFKQLDVDNDGAVTLLELELLLLEWGLPTIEAKRYLKRADDDGDGKVSFDEFFRNMRPVWRFIFFDIFQAENAAKDTEMIGRSLSAFKDQKKTDQLKQKIKQDLLAAVPFLEGAREDLIADLASSMVQEQFLAGDVVFAEGSVGDKFYLVGQGIARVTKGGDVISDLGKGGCIGEGALLTDDPRAATVTALKHCTLYSLTRGSFEYLTEKYPAVREQLRSLHRERRVAFIARTIQQELLSRVPFLRKANDTLIADLAASLSPERFAPGDVVLQEGSKGERFYLIEHGVVRVSKEGQLIAELSKGGCFGEGALLSDEPRAATATAIEETKLFSLTRETFAVILDAHPEVKNTVLEMHQKRRKSLSGKFSPITVAAAATELTSSTGESR